MTAMMTDTATVAPREHRTMRLGRVISDKGDKTITVLCDYMVKHPKYGKFYRRSTKLRAHDERNEAKVGDVVEIFFCRRLSKTKCWRLTRILRAGSQE
jgi:small subunit ribosomal protein S17